MMFLGRRAQSFHTDQGNSWGLLGVIILIVGEDRTLLPRAHTLQNLGDLGDGLLGLLEKH